MTTTMLDSLLIRNFRLFRHLEIERLSRVNLVVGKNNSGKSALLEAIRLFASSADPAVLKQIVRSRQELRRHSLAEADPYLAHDVRHIFYGRKLPDLDQEGLRVGPLNHADDQIHLTTAAFRQDQSREVLSISRVHAADATDGELLELDDIGIYLVLENGSGAQRLLNLSGSDRYRWPSSGDLRLRPGQACPVQIVPSRDPDSRRLAALWDTVSLTDLEREVVAGVRLVDPDIEGIAFIDDAERPTRARVPMARHKISPEPLPLNSMGDGVARLFHIVLALTTSRSGILLVDEFENGLHWTVQPKVWEIVFRLAAKLDVQVFASTHSKDCVKSFGEVWQQQEDAGSLHRLNIIEDDVSVTPYTCETLMDSLETHVEIR